MISKSKWYNNLKNFKKKFLNKTIDDKKNDLNLQILKIKIAQKLKSQKVRKLSRTQRNKKAKKFLSKSKYVLKYVKSSKKSSMMGVQYIY